MLHLSYILHEHGSAAVSIGDGETTVEIWASYLSDALGDLARAARGILRGLPEATCAFQDEPGEHRVVMSREGDDVRLSVFRCAETFSRKQHGELLLTAECSLQQLATACINCLRRVLDDHGEEGYRRRWKNYAFPIEAAMTVTGVEELWPCPSSSRGVLKHTLRTCVRRYGAAAGGSC